MKTALIIGATGLIGKELTKLILNDNYYSEVKLLLRSPIDLKHQKLNSIIYDFDHPDMKKVKADDIYCCLGTTIKKAGSEELFFKVDHDYILQTAIAGHKNGAGSFSMVSSMGANPKSNIFYNRTKGLIEQSINKLHYKSIYVFRPSLLLGKRKEKRFGERIAQFVMGSLSFIIPGKYKAVQAKQVARAMIETVKNEQSGSFIFENDMIHLV